MKRIHAILFALLLLIMPFLTACQVNSSYGEEQKFVNTVETLIEALDDRDKQAVKDLLAPVLAAQSGIDEQLDALIEFYKGPHVEIIDADMIHSDRHYGEEEQCSMDADFIVTTADETLHVWMEMDSVNEADESQIGIRMLCFATDEAYQSERFCYYMSEWDDALGIYVQSSIEPRTDICWLDGKPLRYKEVTDADGMPRVLTAEDLLSALERDPSMSGLTALLGEPNAVWDVYCCYYYELSDGSWIACCTYWEGTNVHVNDNEDLIGYAYYVGEEGSLGTCWKKGQ